MANFYTPNTAVHLCNVPLNQNNKNQIALYAGDADNGILWSNGSLSDKKSAQLKFFTDRTTHVFTDFTYQRKDNIIRVPVNAEVLFADGTNYCVYQNTHYNGKWFYCYITRIEFINENMTALHIKTDVFQTWFFEWYKNNHMDVNFIARNTVLNDDIFKHTLPEPLPQPEYIVNDTHNLLEINNKNPLSAYNIETFNDNYWCVVVTSEKIKFLSGQIQGNMSFMGGIPSPSYFYACDLGSYYDFMNKINSNGQGGAIVSCMAIPKFMVDFTSLENSPIPPSPDPPTPQPSIPENYLGSPYASSFFVTQAWNAPTHWGIDLDNNDDLNLYATTDGQVIAAVDHPSFGKTVIIKSSTWNTSEPWQYYYFMYCHMDSMAVQSGQTVTRGTYIGVQGDTGQSTASHCHYEVQIHGALSPMTTATEVGSTFGHDVISVSQSVDPTIFTNFPNQEGYY